MSKKEKKKRKKIKEEKEKKNPDSTSAQLNIKGDVEPVHASKGLRGVQSWVHP